MENASKALLIAAGVLMVILIIAVSMRIFNSTDGITADADEVGESISTGITDASDKISYALDDINEKSLIKVGKHTVSFRNNWYINYTTTPKLMLEPNTSYRLSFNYKIKEADGVVSCGIGYGESTYSKDIIYGAPYPNQTQGTFSYVITTKANFNYTNREG